MERNRVKWSYSAWSDYKNCPKKYYHLRVAKDVKDRQTDALLYGSELHKAAENYIRDNEELPERFAYIRPVLTKLAALPGEKHCEYKMGLTRDWQACEFFGEGVWWRGIADFLSLDFKKRIAWLADYKTGKSSKFADKSQLELLSLAIFAHFPGIQRVRSALIYVVAEDVIRADFTNEDCEALTAKWGSNVGMLEKNYEVDVWNAKPNSLCRFCPVKTCEHNLN